MQIKAEARRDAETEPALASYLYSTIISHSSLDRSLSFHLGKKLCSSTLLSTLLYDIFINAFSTDPELRAVTIANLLAACVSFSHCLLNYKGFLACQVCVQMAVVGGEDKFRTSSLLVADCNSCVFVPEMGPLT
nr:serine acetyltransferase 5 [Ipomoea batatas]